MNVLFVCNQGQNRSRTAEEIFLASFPTQSAGLYNQRPLTRAQLEWADVVVVMEEAQREEIGVRFPNEYVCKRILNFDIPDIYAYMQPELVALLKVRASLLLEPFLE